MLMVGIPVGRIRTVEMAMGLRRAVKLRKDDRFRTMDFGIAIGVRE
jgi:hypothetical protein